MGSQVPTLRYERALWRDGLERVVGVDEVGVAPTCGAVVAAAVIMRPNCRRIHGVRDSKTLSAPAVQTLKDLQVKTVIIVGGVAAVSQAVETAIAAAGFKVEYRIAGTDRTATAAQIATWALQGLPLTPTYQPLAAVSGWVANSSTAWIARGDSFADALAAGSAAGSVGESILLTANPTTLGPGIATYFAGQGGTITDLLVLGGSAAVSAAVLNSAITALGAPGP